jgi:hypothetical protein
MVYIALKDFKKEHKHLIPLLKKGTTGERMKEANKQQKELKMVISRSKKQY